MADAPINTPGTNPGGDKELSMEKRLLLAFGLMFVVLLGMPYFMSKFGPPPPAKPGVQKQVQTPTPAPASAAATPAAQQPAGITAAAIGGTSSSGPVAAAKEETFVLETDLYRVTLSNRGANVRSLILKKYRDQTGRLVELTSAKAAPVTGWPFSYWFNSGKPETDLDQALFVAKPSDDHLAVDFEYSDGKVIAKKSFRLAKDRYQVEVRSDVRAAGAPLPHLLTWRGGFGDRTIHNAAANESTIYYDGSNSKLVTKSASNADKGILSQTGNLVFAGLQDAYFAAVVLPPPGVTTEIETWRDEVVLGDDPNAKTAMVGAAIGGNFESPVPVFIGPKDMAILRSTDKRLEQMVDWGFFAIIAKPLFLALRWVYENLFSNWGWAIIFVTIIINLLMIPLRFSSLRSAQKMQSIQPQVAAINEKYKNVGMRDAKKAQQNEELMALYQKHGINPLGGCLPLVLQMPFFFAFYKVLSVSIELRDAKWLWVSDLSQPELSWIRILPLMMVVTQVVLQKLTPTTGGDPNQQRMMMFMPLMLGFFFYSSASGLVLYWLTGNLVGIILQYFFNKAAVKPVPATVSKKKN
jgi:YidC/Oxa1 family membrane protein insertase